MIKQMYLPIWKKWIYFSKSWIKADKRRNTNSLIHIKMYKNQFYYYLGMSGWTDWEMTAIEKKVCLKFIILTNHSVMEGHTEKYQDWWGDRKEKIWMRAFTVVSTGRNSEAGYARSGLANLSTFSRLYNTVGCSLSGYLSLGCLKLENNGPLVWECHRLGGWGWALDWFICIRKAQLQKNHFLSPVIGWLWKGQSLQSQQDPRCQIIRNTCLIDKEIESFL